MLVNNFFIGNSKRGVDIVTFLTESFNSLITKKRSKTNSSYLFTQSVTKRSPIKVVGAGNAGVGRAWRCAGARTGPSSPPHSPAAWATVPLNKLHAATPNRFGPIASPLHHQTNNRKSFLPSPRLLTDRLWNYGGHWRLIVFASLSENLAK